MTQNTIRYGKGASAVPIGIQRPFGTEMPPLRYGMPEATPILLRDKKFIRKTPPLSRTIGVKQNGNDQSQLFSATGSNWSHQSFMSTLPISMAVKVQYKNKEGEKSH